MKTEKNILIAFLLNLLFSCFEFAGGVVVGSIAIVSDAVHDLGDAASIGISYVLEKKSKRQPDEAYTYGYARYSVLGGALAALILLVGSTMVIYNAVTRMIRPAEINYDGMILFALIGLCVNGCAAFVTGEGKSLNQKVVNLHMMEDVLGWAVVLVGAVVMRFTDLAILDPVVSVGVALFLVMRSVGYLNEAVGLFLEKAPRGLDGKELRACLSEIVGVLDVHHIHVWSMDGHMNCATMHIVTNQDPVHVKQAVREELRQLGVGHVTLELEAEGERCHAMCCHVEHQHGSGHYHHHRH